MKQHRRLQQLEDNKIIDGRLEDFRAVLRWHLASKINHYVQTGQISGPGQLYAALTKWNQWREGSIGYSRETYADVAMLNDCGLRRETVRSIFGRMTVDGHKVWIDYAEAIASDKRITVRDHGTQVVKGERHAFSNLYLLPEDEMQGIFSEEETLAAVLDFASYTPRQQRIIKSLFLGLPKRKPTPKSVPAKSVPAKSVPKTTPPEEEIDLSRPPTHDEAYLDVKRLRDNLHAAACSGDCERFRTAANELIAALLRYRYILTYSEIETATNYITTQRAVFGIVRERAAEVVA